MSAAVLFYAGLTAIGLVLSALFSGMETGIYTINRVRLSVRAAAGHVRAVRLRHEMSRPTRMLATLLIGNNIANYAGSYGIAAVLDQLGFTPGQAIAINAGILIPLLFVFGETLPKDLFRTHTDRWSYVCSGFLAAVRRLLTWTGLVPFVQWFGRLTSRALGGGPGGDTSARQRISQLIKEGAGAGVLSESQITLADRVLAIHQTTVRDEMVPWREVRSIRINADARAREQLMRRTNATRVPVLDLDGRPVGVLSLLEAALDPGRTTEALMSPVLTMEPRMNVLYALRTMQEARQRLAVVVAPSTGRPVGLVTIKDLVEPLTGELLAW